MLQCYIRTSWNNASQHLKCVVCVRVCWFMVLNSNGFNWIRNNSLACMWTKYKKRILIFSNKVTDETLSVHWVSLEFSFFHLRKLILFISFLHHEKLLEMMLLTKKNIIIMNNQIYVVLEVKFLEFLWQIYIIIIFITFVLL